eukprot:sb/3464965/
MSINEELAKVKDLNEAQVKSLAKLMTAREKAAASAAATAATIAATDNRDRAKTSADMLKYGAIASRKPDIFDPTTTAISDFVEQYESYIQILGLTGPTAVKVFLTYLNSTFQNQVREAGLGDYDDWTDFKERVIPLLQSLSKESKLIARLKLQKAKQEPGESIMDFGEKLRKLGKSGYPARGEKALREAALHQALCMGVLRDEIGVQLLHEATRDVTFTELLQFAAQREIAYTARGEARDEAVSVSVLSAETLSTAPITRGNGPRNRQCWGCGQYGHPLRYCKNIDRSLLRGQPFSGPPYRGRDAFDNYNVQTAVSHLETEVQTAVSHLETEVQTAVSHLETEVQTAVSHLETEVQTAVSHLETEVQTAVSHLETEVQTAVSHLETEVQTAVSHLETEVQTAVSHLETEVQTAVSHLDTEVLTAA